MEIQKSQGCRDLYAWLFYVQIDGQTLGKLKNRIER